MKTQSQALSFSFQQNSQKRHLVPHISEDMQSIQDQLITGQAIALEDFDNEVDLNEILVETSTQEYNINQQLSSQYPSAIRTSRTLYEILIICLIEHLYSDHSRAKLIELKSLVYSQTQLEDLSYHMSQIPQKYSSIFSTQLIKTVFVKCFHLFDRELEGRPVDFEYVLKILSKYPITVFALAIILRKLVKKLSLTYEMEIEDESVYRYQAEPELDVLWLICDFFEVNIVVYQLDGRFIKEQKFKVREGPSFYLVRNSESGAGWNYLCLREHKLREVSEIHPDTKLVNENYWKTNSSASELKLITSLDRGHQDNSPPIPTKRKGRGTHGRSQRQREEFVKEFAQLMAETEHVLRKGDQVLRSFQKLFSGEGLALRE